LIESIDILKLSIEQTWDLQKQATKLKVNCALKLVPTKLPVFRKVQPNAQAQVLCPILGAEKY